MVGWWIINEIDCSKKADVIKCSLNSDRGKIMDRKLTDSAVHMQDTHISVKLSRGWLEDDPDIDNNGELLRELQDAAIRADMHPVTSFELVPRDSNGNRILSRFYAKMDWDLHLGYENPDSDDMLYVGRDSEGKQSIIMWFAYGDTEPVFFTAYRGYTPAI